MENRLNVARAHIEECAQIKSDLCAANELVFDSIITDYITVTCYAEFERKVNDIIDARLSKSGAFSRRYIEFSKKGKQQLHGHLNKENLKGIIKQVFLKTAFPSKQINDNEWNLYINFIKFRDSIAHQNSEYESNKGTLILSIAGDYMNIVIVLEKILNVLNPIKAN